MDGRKTARMDGAAWHRACYRGDKRDAPDATGCLGTAGISCADTPQRTDDTIDFPFPSSRGDAPQRHHFFVPGSGRINGILRQSDRVRLLDDRPPGLLM